MPSGVTDPSDESPTAALVSAVRAAQRVAFGRPAQPVSAAPRERNMLSLSSLPGGTAPRSGFEAMPLPPSPPVPLLPAIRAVMPSRGRADGPFADRQVVLFVTDDADATRGDIPDEIAGYPVECASFTELLSGDLGPASQARKIAPVVATDRFGTVTQVFSRGGTNWVMTCSHVAAPSGSKGGQVVFETGVGTITYLTRVVAGELGCAIDVAIASTTSAIDERWPDGRPFGGTVAPAEAVGPFAFFGTHSSGASFQEFEPEASVNLLLASGATVTFTGQHRFNLETATVEHGDSGGAVRDASDRLVGLVVGCDADGAGYFTPIDRVEAWLDSLEL